MAMRSRWGCISDGEPECEAIQHVRCDSAGDRPQDDRISISGNAARNNAAIARGHRLLRGTG